MKTNSIRATFIGGGDIWVYAKLLQHGMFLPQKFFTTSGKGESGTLLNAFDMALMAAHIDQCNIVQVSSILPPDAIQLKNPIPVITPGTITFAVLARMDGQYGETIGAGVGWAFGDRDNGVNFGIVAEDHGFKSKESVERSLSDKLDEMARVRMLKITKKSIQAESIEVRENNGCVIVALIYVPWEIEEGCRIL